MRFGGPYEIQSFGFDYHGNMYIMGTTNAAGAPPAGATQMGPAPTCAGLSYCPEPFVAKISGNQVVHVTLIGGIFCESCWFRGSAGMSVDIAGNVYVSGTGGPGVPTTPGSFQPTSAKGGVYLMKLNQDGTELVFSTFIGSEEWNLGDPTIMATPTTWAGPLAVDRNGNIYVAGATDGVGFPTTPGAYQPAGSVANVVRQTGFIARFDSSGHLLASTVLGGNGQGQSSEIDFLAVDDSGVVHVAGSPGPGFPTTPDGTPYSSGMEGFLARMNPALSQILYSTILQDSVMALEISAGGDSYLQLFGGPSDETIAKIDPTGAIAWVYQLPSTALYLGDSVLLWPDGALLIGGLTWSPEALTQDTLQPCGPNREQTAPFNSNGTQSAVLTALDPNGHLWFSTLLGGSGASEIESMAMKPGGYVFVAGYSSSSDFPGGPLLLSDDTSNGAGFVFNLDLSALPTGVPAPACLATATGGSFTPASAGTVVTVYGSNLGPATPATYQVDATGKVPGELAGTSVTVGDLPAPILSAQSNQVTFVVPQAITGPSTDICFATAAGRNCIWAEVTPLAPAVFYVLNQDGTVNSSSNPAPRGTTISVYGTGMGPYDEVLPDGTIDVASPPALLTTPISAEFAVNQWCPDPFFLCATPPAPAIAAIYYAGAVPGMVLGYWRLDVAVVQNAPADSILQLTFGTANPIQIQLPVSFQ